METRTGSAVNSECSDFAAGLDRRAAEFEAQAKACRELAERVRRFGQPAENGTVVAPPVTVRPLATRVDPAAEAGGTGRAPVTPMRAEAAHG